MVEKTVIKTLELPFDQDWLWYPDANVIVLSPRLDEEGRQRALCDLQAHWRRSCIRIVTDEDEGPGKRTEPFDLPRLSAALSMQAR